MKYNTQIIPQKSPAQNTGRNQNRKQQRKQQKSKVKRNNFTLRKPRFRHCNSVCNLALPSNINQSKAQSGIPNDEEIMNTESWINCGYIMTDQVTWKNKNVDIMIEQRCEINNELITIDKIQEAKLQ